MNIFHTVIGVTGVCLAVTACSSDPIVVQPDKNEAYTREFIKEFGVPASNHNYAMAKHAGLKVTVHETTTVMVTAEVDGTEYLFGDLTLTPGEHALPVTIPSSVKNLTLTTSRGTMTVGVDDTVDLADTPSAYEDAFYASGQGGYFNTEYDTSTSAYKLTWEEVDGDWAPVVAFNPQELLKEFFELNGKENVDNLDYWFSATKDGLVDYMGKDQPINKRFPLYKSESIFANTQNYSRSYYFFPVYWRKNADESKNYETWFYQIQYGEMTPSSFMKLGGKENIPFPDLGYSTTTTDISKISDPTSSSTRSIEVAHAIRNGNPDEAPDAYKYYISSYKYEDITDIHDVHAVEGFVFDDGTFEEAFPMDEATMVLSRGIKVSIPGEKNVNNKKIGARLGMAIRNGANNVSHSAPFFNRWEWDGNYFDESLDYIFFANSSSQHMDVPSMFGAPAWISDKEVGNRIGVWKGNFLNDYSAGTGMLVGFGHAATKAADTTPRNFCDVIYLMLPVRQSADVSGIWSGPTAFDWIVAAEDLGGSYDWDFNDVVFSFNDILASLNTVNKNAPVALSSGPGGGESVRIITVKPLAAGGTMPVYVTYTGRVMPAPVLPTEGSIMYSEAEKQLKDFIAANAAKEEGSFILGTEMHKWLGSRGLSPINVGEEIGSASGQAISFVIPTEYSNDNFDEVDWSVNASGDNKHLYGFAVLVDKENKLNIDTRAANGYQQVPDLILGQDTYLIGAPDPAKGKVAPQLILMHPDWQWPQEETDIRLAYPTFVEWVSTPDYVDWHKSPVIEHVTRRK